MTVCTDCCPPVEFMSQQDLVDHFQRGEHRGQDIHRQPLPIPIACVRSSPTHEQIGQEIGALVEKKQAAYGDSFGRAGAVMAILYPTGIPLEKVNDALTVVRIIDKLFRIATNKDALGEDPFRDIAGYAILAVARQGRKGP